MQERIVFTVQIQFPILGGRLLKRKIISFKEFKVMFPILGGRLLKLRKKRCSRTPVVVSNPWREAIEVGRRGGFNLRIIVSNPWREAIEEISLFVNTLLNAFPILGGRLLKRIATAMKNEIGLGFQSLEGGY